MFRRAEAVPLEPVAVGWGGLLGGASLVAGSALSGPLGPAIALGGCLVGGFLTGIRAPARRVVHGALTGGLAIGFYLVFIVLAQLAELLGARAVAPGLVPGGGMWALVFPLCLVAAAAGASVSDRMLRPRRPRRISV